MNLKGGLLFFRVKDTVTYLPTQTLPRLIFFFREKKNHRSLSNVFPPVSDYLP